ncbi:MAG: thiamine-phosphate kinase, partial [Nevskiales bacterium]
HILKASKVGADIELAKLPRSQDFQRLRHEVTRLFPGDHTLQYQLAGGDDYELCACLPPDRLEAVGNRVTAGITVIGVITPGPGLRWLDAAGAQAKLALGGYDHFAGT